LTALYALLKPAVLLGAALFGGLSLCSLTGGLMGIAIGFFFGLLQWEIGVVAIPLPQLLQVALALAVFGALIGVMVVGVWMRYGVSAVLAQILANALFTALLTVFVANLLVLPWVAWLVGLLAGVLVGWLLCLLCGRGFLGEEVRHV
jgi:hypothetical protein